MSIDREAVRAPYLQLADILRDRITSGQIPPGRRIPSQMELEQEFDISRNTIKKALDVLKREGLLVTAPGRGLFVRPRDTENPPPPTRTMGERGQWFPGGSRPDA